MSSLKQIRWQICALVLLSFVFIPQISWSQGVSWQDAVAQLAAERTRAETCASLLKRYAGNNAAAMSHGELAYAVAKAETDGVVAGLIVVLAQGETPPSLSDLESRLKRGVEEREAFCRGVIPFVPNTEGSKSPIIELLGDVLGRLIQAAVDLYKAGTEEDELLRKTIQTQLEATKWSAFADIKG